MALHSKIGASSYHRWGMCPGSVRLCEGISETTSPYAEEGIKAHELAAAILLGTTYPNPDPEMLEAVEVYTSLVNELAERGSLLIEQKFDLEKIHPGLFGTADAVIYDENRKTLHVVDYKHGAGVAVDVKENEQLMYYGLGALMSLNLPCEFVELIIVQPRCPHMDGPIRRWLFPAIDLLDFAADLKLAALATLNPNAPLVPGNHCRFCPAAGKCPALANKAIELAKAEFSPFNSYDPEKLALTLTNLPLLEGYIKSVREFAYQEAMHGRTPPGWKLVQKRVTRKWRNEESTPIDLMATFKLQSKDIFLEELKSPAQIEKLISKENREKFNELVVAESSGQTLAPVSDKREAVKLDAKTEFKAIGSGIFD